MLNYNKNIDDRFMFNVFNDVVDLVNSKDDLNNDVHGDVLRIVILVEDKDNNFTSFSLESKVL